MADERTAAEGDGGAEAEEADDRTVTVRVRPNVTAEQLARAAQAPAVPEPPRVVVEKPDTATARAAFGETKPVPVANTGVMMAVSLVGSIVAGAVVGFLVDRAMNNAGTPWGLIIGAVVGILTGFVTVQGLGKNARQ
jgi:hypothetical protein